MNVVVSCSLSIQPVFAAVDPRAISTFSWSSYLDQIISEPEDPSHVEKALKQVQGPAVHPAFAQHCLELLAEGHVDGVFGRQQVAVGDRLLALDWGA